MKLKIISWHQSLILHNMYYVLVSACMHKRGVKKTRSMNFNKPEIVPLIFKYLHVLIDAELNLNSETHKGKRHT